MPCYGSTCSEVPKELGLVIWAGSELVPTVAGGHPIPGFSEGISLPGQMEHEVPALELTVRVVIVTAVRCRQDVSRGAPAEYPRCHQRHGPGSSLPRSSGSVSRELPEAGAYHPAGGRAGPTPRLRSRTEGGGRVPARRSTQRTLSGCAHRPRGVDATATGCFLG